MSSKTAVVFGAGRIARGFVGHLLGLDRYSTTFVDVSPELVDELNARGKYTVHILGNPKRSSVVKNVSAIAPGDPALVDKVGDAEIIFVSVGGANLDSVGEALAKTLPVRWQGDAAPVNIIVCENWKAAGTVLRESITAHLAEAGLQFPKDLVGVSESTIMRSAVDATPEQLSEDPLAKQSQDYWSLPVDADALVTPLLGPACVEPVAGFHNALERKLFTYNSGNATISYLGAVKGHELLSEAANDPEIETIALGVYQEMGAAMVKIHGYAPEEQQEYAMMSLRKFQNRDIVDPIVRQVRDPLRKLSNEDRLVGAALFALRAGIEPNSVAVGIAAALRYRNPEDPSAVKLGELVDRLGERNALAEIGGISQDAPLLDLVMSKIPEVDALAR